VAAQGSEDGLLADGVGAAALGKDDGANGEPCGGRARCAGPRARSGPAPTRTTGVQLHDTPRGPPL
jgi:hypothetical protein